MKTVMMSLVVGMASFSTLADDYVGSYLCNADAVRQQGGMNIDVDSRLELTLRRGDNGLVYLSQSLGHVLTNYAFGEADLATDPYAYYGIFSIGRLQQNPDYNPSVYLDHFQFKPFDAVATSKNDGGGMWGSFVMPQALGKEFSAHYIFQSGDHMGGTIDYTCRRR